ncbi:formate dehydrogenase accessory sulfurtransferase FdhD [Chitinophaga sp. SYP-B3965]|uniref:formate dehydrogenase accessory sulfurtransferase FdhD n=1 Tax=Chitinophaga sp. SYP-B3965 TaxID=2663120 RepID=UPI0012996B70|nr:formate dehydrogenase accessory sulfurtransferase FdhD [Chitinophaga sp. SYP-B3965]MRG44082.1 formate dehydrogenase accessory sulfurtransferase FdhD [Chitinophaga sp. SYP-B3965]
METNSLEAVSMKQVVISRMDGLSISEFSDILSVEEPLEIKIDYSAGIERTQKNISVTMRTPGNDLELAAGFLFTEGIISSKDDIKKVSHAQMSNMVTLELAEGFTPSLMQSDRNFYTTSSCGVCGKDSIQSIRTVNSFCHLNKLQLDLSTDLLFRLPDKLREAQRGFAASGGLHASGLFSLDGELILLREDVGRHNALDKLIGTALFEGLMPLNQHILLLSGRASFELIQKAAMAGISIVAAIGAPSSLAVELAKEFDMTLLGFLKENRFNIYNAGRINFK